MSVLRIYSRYEGVYENMSIVTLLNLGYRHEYL